MGPKARRVAIGVGGLLAVTVCSEASAWERRFAGHGPYDGYGSGYGYAGELVGGDYIGAPLTRFPRPNEIVPPAWGYGTYGVPTGTGIRQAPTAPPTLTVINAAGPARAKARTRAPARNAGGAWPDSGGSVGDPSMPRVIAVTVPRR